VAHGLLLVLTIQTLRATLDDERPMVLKNNAVVY